MCHRASVLSAFYEVLKQEEKGTWGIIPSTPGLESNLVPPLQHAPIYNTFTTIFFQDEDAWINRGCKVVSTNSSHTECECSHLTSFALLTASSGLVGSEVARSIGSGILFDSDSVTGSGSSVTETAPATAHVLTLEIATYLVSTVCLLILILILVQVSQKAAHKLR